MNLNLSSMTTQNSKYCLASLFLDLNIKGTVPPDGPPPSAEEARRALDEAFAEIGIFFSKPAPVVIKLEQHLSRPTFVDSIFNPSQSLGHVSLPTPNIPSVSRLNQSITSFAEPDRDRGKTC